MTPRVTKEYLKHAGMRNLKAKLEAIHKIIADRNADAAKIQHEIMRRKKAGIEL